MKQLVSEDEFDVLLSQSLAIVFKHSTMCSISARALREAEAFLETHPDRAIHEVDVIEHRRLAEHVERVTGIRHQSPQVLVLRQGVVVWHASHSRVTAKAIAAAVS